MNVLLLLGDFGVSSVSVLLRSRHRVKCVLACGETAAPPTDSLREVFRAKLRPVIWPGTLRPLPPDARPWLVSERLAASGIPFRYAKCHSVAELRQAISEHSIDVVLSIGYPHIIPIEPLTHVVHAGLNVHPSLLPLYRGPSPVFWQITAGEVESGITIHRISEVVDAGPVLRQIRTVIRREETAGELFLRLGRLAAQSIVEVLDRLEQASLQGVAQKVGASVQRRFHMQDAQLEWSLPAEALARLVRACSPFPGAFTFAGGGECVRIWRARAVPSAAAVHPGDVIARRLSNFDVGTGDGILRVRTATSDRGSWFPTLGRPWCALRPGLRFRASAVPKGDA